jgi:hypothetical protein
MPALLLFVLALAPAQTPPLCGARPCKPDGPDSPRAWCRPAETK